MASDLITSWQIEGNKMEIVTGFILFGSKTTVDEDSCFLEEKLWQA